MKILAPLSAAALLLLTVPSFAGAAACVGDPGYPTGPFIDANCDACFDGADGDDADISQAELEAQPFLIFGCFVVPKGAHVTIAGNLDWRTQDVGQDITILGDVAILSNQNESMTLRANGELIIGGNIRSSLDGVRTDETPTANVILRGGYGVQILPGARVNAKGAIGIRVTEGGEVTIADGTKLTATKGGVGIDAEARDVYGPWVPPAGRIHIGDRTKIKARREVSIHAAGALEIGAGVAIESKNTDDAPSVRLVAGYRVSQIDSDLGGDLTVGPKFLVKAPDAMAVSANGAIQVAPGAKLTVPNFALSLDAVGDLTVGAMKAASYGFTAHSTSGNVTLAGKLKTNPAGASAAIEAPTGTCDVSAFKGLADTMVTYDCATVVP